MKKDKIYKTCLLITPKSFYSYSEYLKNGLSSFGFEVIICNHEYPESLLGKILGKLHIPLGLSLTRGKIKKRYLFDKSYDLVLIIKGRGISIELIKDLHQSSKSVIAYSYDSFKYEVAPLAWFKQVNKFYTFDYVDGEKYNIPIIELFSSFHVNNESKKNTYEISAIMRNHSNRLKFIDMILSRLPSKNQFIYIFERDIFTFIRNFLTYPLLYIKYRKHIFFKALSYSEYTKVIGESNFTIDYAHPSQSGITMRCFEALSSQTKIITNNTFVFKYKYFNDSNIIVFNDNPEYRENLLNLFLKIEKNIPIKHVRTINHFVKDLLS